jgi:hypothetical protein
MTTPSAGTGAGAGISAGAATGAGAGAGASPLEDDSEFFLRQLRSHPMFDSKLAAKGKKASKG